MSAEESGFDDIIAEQDRQLESIATGRRRKTEEILLGAIATPQQVIEQVEKNTASTDPDEGPLSPNAFKIIQAVDVLYAYYDAGGQVHLRCRGTLDGEEIEFDT